MWHSIRPEVSAAPSAAALLIKGVQLKSFWNGIEFVETGLTAKIDTAAVKTVIPLQLALNMRLSSKGIMENMKAFDRSVVLPDAPKFLANLFIPPIGWVEMEVIACERDDVLLGLDFCRQKLLLANWHECGFGFGMKGTNPWHKYLQYFFTRLRPRKP